MLQEGEWEIRIISDAIESVVGKDCGFFNGVRAQVGQLACLEVAPDHLDRVEVVPVGGKLFDDQPVTLLGDPVFHHLGAMRGQAVPDERQLVITQMLVQVFEELDERVLVVGTGSHVEDQPRIRTIGSKAAGG